jgi:hypothetical protein
MTLGGGSSTLLGGIAGPIGGVDPAARLASTAAHRRSGSRMERHPLAGMFTGLVPPEEPGLRPLSVMESPTHPEEEETADGVPHDSGAAADARILTGLPSRKKSLIIGNTRDASAGGFDYSMLGRNPKYGNGHEGGDSA